MSEELIAKREELRLKAKKLSTWTIYAWGIIGFSFVMAGYGKWADVKVPYTDGIFLFWHRSLYRCQSILEKGK